MRRHSLPQTIVTSAQCVLPCRRRAHHKPNQQRSKTRQMPALSASESITHQICGFCQYPASETIAQSDHAVTATIEPWHAMRQTRDRCDKPKVTTRVYTYLLRVPPPSENEFTSDVWDVDFIDDRPHVAWLRCTKHALAIALRAWHRELGARCAGLRVADWLRLGFGGIGSVVSGVRWLTRSGLVHSTCLA